MRHALLLPFLITLFILDRVFLVCAFWLSSEKFQTWVYKDELILESMYRVSIGLLSFFVIQLFSSLW